MIGEKLKLLRKENKLSQRGLAKALNVANGSISLWENNLRVPDLDDLKRIANFFNIDIAEFVSDKYSEIKENEKLLSTEQKNLIEKIKKLNDTQCIRLNAYADRLLEEIEENKRQMFN